MSVRVMAWVWDHSRSKPIQRLILLAIADCANDRGTDAYPSTGTLASKTGVSERGIRYAIAELEDLGELQVGYKAGPRGCNRYQVIMSDPARAAGSDEFQGTDHPARGARNPEGAAGSTISERSQDPAGDAGNPARGARSEEEYTRQEMPGTRHVVPGTRQYSSVDPARGAPEPPKNLKTKSVSSRKREPTQPAKPPAQAPTDIRGTRIPDDFRLTDTMIAWAEQHTPNVDRDHELAQFVDYWTAKAGKDAAKVDWVATWRSWMRKAGKFSPNGHRTSRQATSDDWWR